MKIISVFVMFVLLGAFANAQNAPRVLAEIAASSEATVKNAPFSAEAVSESVQTLADGNRIVRSSTSKLYRNSEGRFRREMASGSGGMLSPLFTHGQGVTLLDPVGGFRYTMDTNLKTARQMVIRPTNEVKIVTGVEPVTVVDAPAISDRVRAEIKAATEARGEVADRAIVSEKIREEIRATAAVAPIARAAVGQIATDAHGFSMVYSGGSNAKWDKRTEELGTQNIEGIEAEGSRTITTIPAGAIGNERPIEITYEKWYSRDLQLVVMSKHNDPRFGEQTYRLTNIVRSEPDPSLFTVPNSYRLITEPSGTYRVSPSAARVAYEADKATAAGQATKPATIIRTKP